MKNIEGREAAFTDDDYSLISNTAYIAAALSILRNVVPGGKWGVDAGRFMSVAQGLSELNEYLERAIDKRVEVKNYRRGKF